MMKISRLGIFTLILTTIILGANCSLYNRVMARKSLVDGAKAYSESKFKEAEEKFRVAVEYDTELVSLEAKTAQLFLARTIHSEFATNRTLTDKAEEAIKEYKKALTGFLAELEDKRAEAKEKPQDEKVAKELKNTQDQVGSIIRAVASLYENLQQDDNWNEWQTTQASNEKLPNETRSGAYVALAAKEYNCAYDITEAKEVKKTVKEGDKEVFKFSKPEDEEDYDKLKKCVDKGTEYVEKGVELNPESDSAWSYKASLIEQSRRVADMEGETEKIDTLKKQFTEAKEKFQELAEKRKKAEEEEARKAAEAKAKKEGREYNPEGGDAQEKAPAEEKPAEEEPAADDSN